ncbi:hypothetical protein FAGKG844_430046 [Frankia sp. AgKG'84/4]
METWPGPWWTHRSRYGPVMVEEPGGSSVKTVRAVRGALAVLEELARSQPAGVTGLARCTGLDKSAVQRILARCATPPARPRCSSWSRAATWSRWQRRRAPIRSGWHWRTSASTCPISAARRAVPCCPASLMPRSAGPWASTRPPPS